MAGLFSESSAFKIKIMKHTKGEWWLPHFANGKGDCDCGFVLCERYYGAIATVHWSKSRDLEDGDNPPLEEAKANAKLIAAAPELLEALNELRIAIGNIGGKRDRFLNEPYKQALEAIKKATE